MKKAVCVGINNYPGSDNDLSGCVNDANDWSGLLKSYGFQTTVILDSQATRSKTVGAFDSLVAQATSGDVIVLTYSGHGTSVMDTSGDEVDGYDEALYVYDGVLLDDDLRSVLQKTKAGVHVVIISDSCFSGTVTRKISLDEKAKRRYISTDAIPPNTPVKNRFLSEESMVEVLISGCSDSEYSYDAYINGRYNGAFTANAISVLNQGQTYNEFYTALRKLLPSTTYPQTPQLEGSTENREKVLFETDETTPVPEPDPEPNPEPEPEPEPSQSWFSKYWWVIAIVIVILVLLYWVL